MYSRMLLHKYIFLYWVRTTLFSWNGASQYHTPQGYHHPFTYTEAQDTILKHSFGLTAYKITIQNISLSFEASLENVTNTGAVMYFNPSSHSVITSIQFFIILQLPCAGEIIMKSIGNIYNIKIINHTLSMPLALSSINSLRYMWMNHLPMSRIGILVKPICRHLSLAAWLGYIFKCA